MGSDTETGYLSWSVHPLREQLGRTLLLGALLGLVLGVVRLTYPEPIWTALAALLLLGSLARYFFPTTYRLNAQGIEITFLGLQKKRAWNDIRSYYISSTGVFLSPFPKPHRLESFRGLYLLFGSRREEVIDFVRAHVAQEPGTVGKD